MLLAIAASNTHLFSPLSFSAGPTSIEGREGARSGDRTLVDRAKSLFFQGAGRAVGIEERFNATIKEGEVRGMENYKIHYSGKYMGLTIYIARLLRVIWMERISIKT